MLRVMHLRDLQVRLWTHDYLDTLFPGGATCPALFAYDNASRDKARELGYGDDVWQMHADHDPLHTFLAHEQGMPWSPTLAWVAGIADTHPDARLVEEGIVTAFQRYMMTDDYDPQLDIFDDPRGLRDVFRAIRFRR
jgi:hypothetical protein